MSRLRIAARASRDLEEISNYFLAKSVEAGDRFVEGFHRKCQQLVDFPYSGRSYARMKSGLRGTPLMGYIIFYRVMEDSIEIVRVISGYRNLSDSLEE
ncbi:MULTISPECIES: type II toxin-antitoxin system RelE/ParE family toxin [unclassified Roseofilum]|uniref:type II toxin-antitoxin system RelE/ParE family toxin n=1 Tax=unclassified Roseofilum TaxID=2620099 RepID=UPI000E83B062|nr:MULTISPECIES: type II toxin-antitoxin system RelE/ParE family toxin [unclassified Roseofilum]HBR00671.1 type II toxin-antitoxin system RelE/ParE family toxin [Cyanobacteria bacterium UBA11691]MBP0009737.1 type II toxin-antitoxin system RelE/ParE family toxin [Roseofilum sp. Belize Diploria]MBP0015231.1 type II toxin-antitoxin system RelE/ParE family toxin [Roseofilum sp. SID3]MBP0024507.1 type II toxin-antitoxin system RelE/ParE family toxin [Roseofilum sp. SID2]MBP0034397.1 type II toxin-a